LTYSPPPEANWCSTYALDKFPWVRDQQLANIFCDVPVQTNSAISE
jgi:hypothetical protein